MKRFAKLKKVGALCIVGLCIGSGLLLLASCASDTDANEADGSGDPVSGAEGEGHVPVPETRDDLFGTIITITAYEGATPGAVTAALDLAAGIEGRMSVNRAGSEISRLNHAGGQAVSLSPETWDLIETALDFAALSNGAVDPAIGSITALWKEDGAFRRLPDSAEIASALPGARFENIILQQGDQAFLANPDTRLDLGAVAKGYACGRAAESLRKSGVTSALLDFGGNIYALGAKPGADCWVVGITAPYPDDGAIALSVPVRDMAVVTSGGYQRFFETGGSLYHHILDPATGYPADSGLLSVTILSPDSTVADCLSTACFVLGLEKGMALLDGLPDAEGIFITTGNLVYATPGISKDIAIRDGRFTLETP